MAGPYDYPGDYAVRFDGIEAGEWCGYFTSWDYSPGSRIARIRKLRIDPRTRSGIAANLWIATSAPRTLVIEKRNSYKFTMGRWKVRNAKPLRVVGRSNTRNGIAVESLEIVHEGFE